MGRNKYHFSMKVKIVYIVEYIHVKSNLFSDY